MTDRRVLYATAFARSLATGMIAVVLALHLARAGLDAAQIAYVVAAGLAGNAAALVAATAFGDRHGRRRMLLELSALWALGGAVAACTTNVAALAGAAFIGMINGMGRDRGGALAIEQAVLPSLAKPEERTLRFAWYSAVQDAGHALGALLGGVPPLLERMGVEPLAAHRACLGGYAALAIVTLPLYARLSPATEAPPAETRARVSPETRRIVARIAALFALDSLGGGFLTTALLTYLFFERFSAPEAAIAVLFFVSRVMNALSHFGAAWLAKRIDLVNTMVFTHLPSSLLLATVAIAPSFGVAAALFVVREGLVEMDVPTRQSYVMALVRPEERTFASGVTNLVRMAAWPIASLAGGLVMSRVSLVAPLLLGSAMKIAYDVLLYLSFRRLRPPEER